MLKGIENIQISQYNRIQELRNDEALRKAGEQAPQQETVKESPKEASIDLRLDDIRPRPSASLEDISLSLSEPHGFEMKGRDSDLESLDMEKAVSDMQKDQALMQYQYFVGDTNLVNNEDGIVIAK